MKHRAPFDVGHRMARPRLECGDLSPLSSAGKLGGGLNAFNNPRRTKSADKSAHSKRFACSDASPAHASLINSRLTT
jgi:hypothetical protein